MKHSDIKMIDGSMGGLRIPSEAGSLIPGSLHIDGRFLMYRDAEGEKSIEIMDGNDFVEWISYLGRAQTNSTIRNMVTNAATSTAYGSANPKINPQYAVSSNAQQMRAYADLNANITTGDFTFEAWRRSSTNEGSEGYPQDIFTSSNNSIVLRFAFRPPGYWWLVYGQNQIVTPRGENIPPVNDWHHVAVEREGTTLRIYLNGLMIVEKTHALLNLSLSKALFGVQYNQYMPTCHLDEVVLTRVAKYKGKNFVPNNKPIVLP